MQFNRASLGPLAERDFRWLFAATAATSLGDGVAGVALAFAILDIADAGSLGVVIAARQVAAALVLAFGGVLSDRIPRSRVLVGASLLQGIAQAATAALVIDGTTSLLTLVALAAVWGCGSGLVVPAETGLVPQTVSPDRLQQANALQGLTRSATWIVGPALGGVLVVTMGAGVALAVDSATFFACAALLTRIAIPPRQDDAEEPYLTALRAGWREFRLRTWLWSTVLLFGVGNVFYPLWQILGPVILADGRGGAASWATILAASGVGSILGGLWTLRHRPSRPLVACVLWVLPFPVQLLALTLGAPVGLVALAAVAGGVGTSVHLALWFTVLQREVPERSQSRVASYDALGSMVLSPLGAALAGPLSAGLGAEGALTLGAVVTVACLLAMVAIPSVRAIRAAPVGEPSVTA